MVDAETIAAQQAALPDNVQKAIQDAWNELREKALSSEDKLSKAQVAPNDNQPKSWFSDPFAVLDSVGMGYRNSPTYLNYDTLRQVAERDTYVAPIILTRIGQVGTFARVQPNKYSVGFLVRPRFGDKKRRLSQSEKDRCDQLTMTLLNTGNHYNLGRDGLRQFIAKFVRDSLTYDQACFESVRTRGGGIHSFNAVDSSTIRTATPKQLKGTPPHLRDLKKDIRYVQVINAQRTAEFTLDEMAFCVRNPRSGIKTYGYGFPEIETLITTITSHLWAEEWNRRMFSQGSTVKGLLNVKGNVQPLQFEAFKRMWHSQVAGVQNAWKTPMLNSEEVQWIPMQLSNTEMGYQMWMEYLCFVPGTRVHGKDGEVRIEDVEPGDEVFTHTGELHRVVATETHRHVGKIVNVSAGGSTLQATPEHPFFVSERDGVKMSTPRWVDAKDLDPAMHYLIVPKRTYEAEPTDRVVEIDVSGHVTSCESVDSDDMTIRSAKKFAHNNVRSMSRYIDVDEDAAFVLGLYVAEGNATARQVFFTFHKDERDLADRVVAFADGIGCNATIYKAKDSVLNVRISGRLVAEMFVNVCGDGAHNKRVPDAVMRSPRSVQRAFFSGYFAGDGSVPDFASGSVTATLVSVSPRLVDQLQTILLRDQIFAYRYDLPLQGSGATWRGGRKHRLDVNGTEAVKLSRWLGGTKGSRLAARVKDHERTLKTRLREDAAYFYVPIHEVTTEDYDGPVHNFEVEGDNTYQVNRLAVHNCKVTCALYQIDPAEINFDLRGGVGQQPVFMSTNEAQQKASKDRGLQPLLGFVEDALNRNVVWKIDPRFEMAFVGLDAKTEEQAMQLRQQQAGSHLKLNEVRAMDDLPPVEHGDVVLNPVYIGYRTQMMMMEQQSQQAQQPQPGQPGQAGQAGPPPRFNQPPGAEENHGAEQVRQFAEDKSSGQPGTDDESDGPSPRVLSQLHADDWDSVVSHSLKSDDLAKGDVYDEIDLD
jgi:intein/homing endonuclease